MWNGSVNKFIGEEKMVPTKMRSTVQQQQISESYFQQILTIRHHRKMPAVQKQSKQM